MPSNNQPTPKSRSKALDALDLRRDGHPWRVVAERVGYADESGARHAVDRLLARTETEGVETYRGVELMRLDELHRTYWTAAVGGDTKAAGIVLGALDRRVRLLGIAAPVAVEVATVSDFDFATEAARLVREIGATEPSPDARSADSGELSPDPWVLDDTEAAALTDLKAPAPETPTPTPAAPAVAPVAPVAPPTPHPLTRGHSMRGVPPIENLFRP
ncbi:hypothetical protein HQ314_00125 [Rhodococcus sp. BP-332]|uniref:hypothetical protein n=1 Tax=Rhodococcus sp. BP-332 TaxID=2739447 RepID=UPI001C9AC413|nr:hypothetical protein [Rhodococcus sp. BP-332]MBY6675321.1 hypothetical protein [Rhodococcus sp. BP-332]